MAYLPHCRVRIEGVLGASALAFSEIFNTGFQISDDNFANLPSQGQVDLISGEVAYWYAQNAMALQFNSFYTGLTVSAIDAAGHVRLTGTGAYMQLRSTTGAPAAGAVSSTTRPFQIASVTTLVTNRAGARGRGRMYWPVPAEAVDEDGYTGDTAAQQRANTVASLLNAVNGHLASGAYQGRVVVASSAGFLSPVTAVRVGTVLDTQRRRRNALQESYKVAAV